MGYKQTKSFNQALGGNVKGMCLRNVRLGYSIGPKYASATQAWNNTQKHTDAIPLGVDVPLYYSYSVMGVNLGHINVRLANGTVWSDGQIFSSLANYLATRAPKYLGWGESINDVRVLEWVNNPTPSKMPPVGSKIKLAKGTTRNTYVAGTTQIAGTIRVTDDSFIYEVRGYDAKYPNRVLINSKSAGGDGVALALYFVSGLKISGWSLV